MLFPTNECCVGQVNERMGSNMRILRRLSSLKAWPHRARLHSQRGKVIELHALFLIGVATSNAFALPHHSAASHFAGCQK